MSAAQNSNRFYNLSTWKRRTLLVTVVIAAFAMLAALAEGAVRVRAWVKYGNFERIEDTYVFDAVSNLRIPRAGWTNGRIVINSQGCRSPEISEKRLSKSIRIAFLGGSTTYCAEVRSNEATWPHLVAEELTEYLPDITIEYINAGVPGYGVAHSLRALKHRVAKFEPNLIVIYHATNDLSSNSFVEAKRQGIVSRRSEEKLSWGSHYSLLWYLVEKNLTIMALQQSADELQGKIELDSESIAAPFRSDLRQLVHTSSLAAPLVAIVTFSTQLRADQSPAQRKRSATTSLFYMPYMSIDDLLSSFSTYNDVLRKVADEFDSLLIEDELAIPGDSENFVDSVHFTDQGSLAMSQRVVKGITSSQQFEALVDTVRSK